MLITFSTDDPLERVLKLVETVYGVQVREVGGPDAAHSPGSPDGAPDAVTDPIVDPGERTKQDRT